eukprot:13898560-Ditylum_brightwellii.AAC.1
MSWMTRKRPSNVTRSAKDRPSVTEDHFVSAKQTAWGKQRKKYCDYHGLCYHDTSECNLAKSCKKHVQPTH